MRDNLREIEFERHQIRERMILSLAVTSSDLAEHNYSISSIRLLTNKQTDRQTDKIQDLTAYPQPEISHYSV